MIAAHGWSTDCAVAANGVAWRSANGGWGGSYTPGGSCGSRYGNNYLASSGGSHSVTSCSMRVLARCP